MSFQVITVIIVLLIFAIFAYGAYRAEKVVAEKSKLLRETQTKAAVKTKKK